MARRPIRRIVVLLCLAALLVLLLAPTGHVLPVAVLAPFWVVLAVLPAIAVRLEDIAEPIYAAPCLAVPSGRAPPAR